MDTTCPILIEYVLLLPTFCTFIKHHTVRIVGGALLVAAEEIRPAVTGLYIGGYSLEASGLSPLLLCTLALLHMTSAFSRYSFDLQI